MDGVGEGVGRLWSGLGREWAGCGLGWGGSGQAVDGVGEGAGRRRGGQPVFSATIVRLEGYHAQRGKKLEGERCGRCAGEDGPSHQNKECERHDARQVGEHPHKQLVLPPTELPAGDQPAEHARRNLRVRDQ